MTRLAGQTRAVEHEMEALAGIDAPICQDGRSGRQVCGLARSVVCHHALKDLAGEKACETADDLPFGPPFSGASFDVVEGWCVEPHPHDDGPVERGVGLAMTAAVEAVAPRRHPGRSRDGAGPAKLGEGGFSMNPIGGVAKDDQQFGGGVGTDAEARTQRR